MQNGDLTNVLAKYIIVFLRKQGKMAADHYQEKNEREHAEERRQMEHHIASGQKSAWEIQQENSIFPLDATVEIDWVDLSKRYKRISS